MISFFQKVVSGFTQNQQNSSMQSFYDIVQRYKPNKQEQKTSDISDEVSIYETSPIELTSEHFDHLKSLYSENTKTT